MGGETPTVAARSIGAGVAVAGAVAIYGLVTGTLVPPDLSRGVTDPQFLASLAYGVLILPVPISMGAIAVLAADKNLFAPVGVLVVGVVMLPTMLAPRTNALFLWLLVGLALEILGLGVEYGVRRSLGRTPRLLPPATERALAVGSVVGLVYALTYWFVMGGGARAYHSPAADPLLEFGFALYSLTGLVTLAGLPVMAFLRYRAATPLVLCAGYGYLVVATPITGPGTPAGEPDLVLLLWPGFAMLYLLGVGIELGVRRRLRRLPFG